MRMPLLKLISMLMMILSMTVDFHYYYYVSKLSLKMLKILLLYGILLQIMLMFLQMLLLWLVLLLQVILLIYLLFSLLLQLFLLYYKNNNYYQILYVYNNLITFKEMEADGCIISSYSLLLEARYVAVLQAVTYSYRYTYIWPSFRRASKSTKTIKTNKLEQIIRYFI